MTTLVAAPNVALLRRTFAQVARQPDKWNQKEWRCRTGKCFAGWAVELAGGVWSHGADNPTFAGFLLPDGDDPPGVAARYGGYVPVAERAQRVLGLTDAQADELFNPKNTLTILRRIVTDLCGGEL